MIPLISIDGGIFGILNHRATLIFMHLGFSVSMAVFMYHGFIKGSIPLSLEEAAQIDGASRVRTFFQIVFPLLKPTTVTLIILYALSLWNDYLLPSLILTDKNLYTIPIATKLFQGAYGNDMDLLMATLVMAIIPVIILYLALQKYIIAGVVAGAVKNRNLRQKQQNSRCFRCDRLADGKENLRFRRPFCICAEKGCGRTEV